MTSFVNKVKVSKKAVLRQLFNLTMRNTGTVTGRNLRGILIQMSKSRVEEYPVSSTDSRRRVAGAGSQGHLDDQVGGDGAAKGMVHGGDVRVVGGSLHKLIFFSLNL